MRTDLCARRREMKSDKNEGSAVCVGAGSYVKGRRGAGGKSGRLGNGRREPGAGVEKFEGNCRGLLRSGTKT